jgi:phosphatidylglycerol:prolipoprotein diacylglycerol transferase
MIPYLAHRTLNLFGFGLGTYVLIAAVAVCIGIFLAVKEMEQRKINKKDITYSLISAFIGVYFGARIFYFFSPFGLEYNWYNLFLPWKGGGTSIGGIVGAIAGISIYALYKKQNIWNYLNSFALSAAAAFFIARIGCSLHGCCSGIATDLPWAWYNLKTAALTHPTQIYDSFANLCILCVLIFLRKKGWFKKNLVLWFLMLYSSVRFFLEFKRLDYINYNYAGMDITQWLCLGIFIVSLILLIKRSSKFSLKGKITAAELNTVLFVFLGGILWDIGWLIRDVPGYGYAIAAMIIIGFGLFLYGIIKLK